MNENHKKRGLTHSKLLTAVAISSLLLSSGNVMAVQANPDKIVWRNRTITSYHHQRFSCRCSRRTDYRCQRSRKRDYQRRNYRLRR